LSGGCTQVAGAVRRQRRLKPFLIFPVMPALERRIGSGFQLLIQSIDGTHDGKKSVNVKKKMGRKKLVGELH
jgi:hypothetical protein